MTERYTRALVLSHIDVNDHDAVIRMFTEEFGKVVVRAKSIRKITSKLSAHFQPLSFVKMRFVPRSGISEGFVLVDGLEDEAFAYHGTRQRDDLVEVIEFLDVHTYPLEPDQRVWFFLEKVFSGMYHRHDVARILLSVLGFDATHASCGTCSAQEVVAFYRGSDFFVCGQCALKLPKNEVLYIQEQ